MPNKNKSIALFNDTGNYPHIGCRAVSDSHNALLSTIGVEVIYRHFVNDFTELWTGDFESSVQNVLKSGLLNELSSVDAVVVNGEGTIHHGHGLHLLAIVKAAQAIGKPTYIVNAVIQDVPIAGLKVLAELKDLTVRDLFSYQYLKKMGIDARLVADSILGARFDEGVDDCWKNKILVTDCVVSKTNTSLFEVAKHFGSDAVYFPLEGSNAHNWKGVLKKIRGCRLMVTGRHHGLYLALMAKVPFVALSSNTWKVEGTLAALQYSDNYNKKESLRDILDMCNAALENSSAFEKVFSHSFISKPLSTFSLLAKHLGLTANDLSAEADSGSEISRFYENRWDLYWRNNLECKTANDDQKSIADGLLMACGLGRTLDVGSGAGRLVSSLLRAGVDADGVDVSKTAASHCSRCMPGRFTQGSVLELPFEDASFHTVVSIDTLQHLAPEDVPKALKEIHRVASRFVFLQIATTPDRDGHWHLTVERRAWWEAKCFEAGFRKHPAYYKVNPYESLNEDGWQITIVLEKIPEHAHKKYPLSALAAERDLHMDMLREIGECSDAHVARYLLAEKYVRQGDRVLDAACGLGYGSYALAELSKASKITGVDGSDYGVDYARENFCSLSPKLDFFAGYLPECLAKYPDGHFDVIVSFETLEHVEHPEALLTEFYRLLSPGGRIVVSVPNDWSDETGEDPNPHHLHVYDWHRLRTELSKHFILEKAFAQTASRCKVREKINQWESRGRSLYPVAWEDESPADCQWWLMTAMKSPLASVQPYLQSVFSNIKDSGHPSIQYAKYFENPWLIHAMVNSEYRLKDASALEALATDVTRRFPLGSNDHSAALCVLSYLSLDDVDSDRKISLITNIDNVLGLPNQNPMNLRWRVSLTFVKARLLESIGRLGDALNIYLECAKIDVKSFGVHLSTKTTEAAYRAGLIACAAKDLTLAKNTWAFGVSIGGSLLEVDLPEVLINPEWPNLFNHGDGAREFALAWDNIARCANGLNLLQSGSAIDYQALENCFQTEYSGVTGDLLHTRKYLAEHSRELVATRETLQERTVRLEHLSDELRSRTEELVATRETLQERTVRLEHLSDGLRSRTEELVATRETLQERTVRLEKSITDLNKLPWFLKKFLGIAD